MVNKVKVIAALRMLFSGENLVVVREIRHMQQGRVLIVEPEGTDALSSLTREVRNWIDQNDNLPEYVSIKGVGTFVIAECAACAEVESRNEKCFRVRNNARMENKNIIITGGAQGFGAGIAEEFFQEGANVVIADLNESAGTKLVEEMNARQLSNRAVFLQTDVSDYHSVKNLVEQTTLHFGGLDAMISNAGILRAGGLDEMSPESFDLMTKVNYTGYFNCVKASAEIMKFQSGYSSGYYFDIIQINSKSGLKGSNKNFAYAGGKFGGLGLTQSFALELMPYRIKVNSICPGNFFDGPLWSDPDKGLFIQYLKAGKVPGAKTIGEVKLFYEAQVPAGRGCGTSDVAKAAFYAIEQEYETGQAIPVTGGQIMLH